MTSTDTFSPQTVRDIHGRSLKVLHTPVDACTLRSEWEYLLSPKNGPVAIEHLCSRMKTARG